MILITQEHSPFLPFTQPQSQHPDRRYVCSRRVLKFYKDNMNAGQSTGDLHVCGVGGRRKRRSPCVRSRWSPKVCKGQHDRRLMKRRSVNMIADRRSGVLHMCVVGGCWSFKSTTWSPVDLHVRGRWSPEVCKDQHDRLVGGCWSFTRTTWTPVDQRAVSMCAESVVVEKGVLHVCVVGGRHDRRSMKRRPLYV